MNWPDSISDALPPERDNEPANLRGDIADELADHLEAAFARERSRCDDDTAAGRAALDRFGNPQVIARRLWFDAMKETLMTQRISLLMQALLVACCFGALGLTWQMMRQSQQANMAFQERLIELVAKSANSNPVAMEWTDLLVKCVQGTEQGAPAENIQLQLSAKGMSAFDSVSMTRTTGSDGVMKFGPLRVGNYELSAKDPFGRWNKSWISLRPGELTEQLAVCPAGEVKTTTVEFDVVPSDDMKQSADLALKHNSKREFVLALAFKNEGMEVAGRRWVLSNDTTRGTTIQNDVLVTLDGKVVMTESRPFSPMPRVLETYFWKLTPEKLSTADHGRSVTLPTGDYTLFAIEARSLDMKPPTAGMAGTMMRFPAPRLSESNPLTSFKATSEGTNRWRIDLPALNGEPASVGSSR